MKRLALITTITSLFFSQTSFANICVSLRGLKTDAEFFALVKQIKPDEEEFNRLDDCWKDQKSIRGKTTFEMNLLKPFEDELTQKSPSLELRVEAYHALKTLESNLENFNLKQFNFTIKNAMDRIRGILPRSTPTSLLNSLQTEITSMSLINTELVPREFEPSLLKFYESLGVENPKEFVFKAFNEEREDLFEKAVLDEFIKNDAFKSIPYIEARPSHRALFEATYTHFYLERAYQSLDGPQRTKLLSKILFNDPRFDELIDETHIRDILKAIGSRHEKVSAARMKEILTKIQSKYPDQILAKENQQLAEDAALRVWKDFPTDRSLRKLAITLVQSEIGEAQVEANFEVFRQSLRSIRPSRELIDREEFSRLHFNSLEECNLVLKPFSNN